MLERSTARKWWIAGSVALGTLLALGVGVGVGVGVGLNRAQVCVTTSGVGQLSVVQRRRCCCCCCSCRTPTWLARLQLRP